MMIAGLLTMLATLTVRGRFDDPDMWWHLRTGQVIWTTHTIPTTDIFSFTTNHHAWVPHEWLAQTIIYAAYRWGGYPGLMLWLCLFASALLVAGYALCTLYSGNAKVSFLGALVIFVFATIGLAIRPQMIGYLLLIVELILIHLGRTRSPRWFWLLPPLFALWINCHGSFFLGILVAAAYLFSSYFEFHIGSLHASAWAPNSRKTLLISWLLSLAALFVNADGIHPILYPLQTMLQLPLGLSSVEEWQPLQFNSQRGVFLLAVLACIALLCIARRAELYLDELILLAAATWLAAGHTRMVFVFGILAAPILSRMIAPFWDDYSLETDHLWPNAVLLFGALAIAFFAFPDKANLTAQVEEKSPAKAVEFIQSHHLSGPMLNAYTFGGYLLWAMPEHPVFVDGRGDVFEWTGVLQQFGQWATIEADPNTLLDKYGIQFCLLERGSPMTFVLPLTHNWKSVYSDNNAVIFVRTTPQPR
ncbi:MAG TPA: hypothetical protein VHZ52_01590 [Acidobacteriaceae bacterium]|jgi:hypothetical protein|nr:hypothetical protein [Acidobacteriaceae bacterium]